MTSLLDIKPYIQQFVEDNLDIAFANKVYWRGERKNVPEYPYCLLTIIAENKDKRTSHCGGDFIEIHESGQSNAIIMRERITTLYKTCTITVSVFNAFVEDTAEEEDTKREADEFAYAQADLLEGAFEDYPINDIFSVQSISSIRPLPDVVSGGYEYCYEFDVTIGYDEARITPKEYGKSVDTKLALIDKNGKKIDDVINFKVTISNNDNIDIET